MRTSARHKHLTRYALIALIALAFAACSDGEGFDQTIDASFSENSEDASEEDTRGVDTDPWASDQSDAASDEDLHRPTHPYGAPVLAPLSLQPLATGSVWAGQLQAWSLHGESLTMAMIGGDERVRFDSRTGIFLVDLDRVDEGPLTPLFRVRDERGLESFLSWAISPDDHFASSLSVTGAQRHSWPAGVSLAVALQVSGKGKGPLRFIARGTVPPGLEFDERNGWVLWNPARALIGHDFELNWKVRDNTGTEAQSQWVMSVIDAQPLALPTMLVDPTHQGPLRLLATQLPPDLLPSRSSCSDFVWEGPDGLVEFNAVDCTLAHNPGAASSWQAGRASWHVQMDSGDNWLIERSFLFRPSAECTPDPGLPFDLREDQEIIIGEPQHRSFSVCASDATPLATLPFTMPQGASWFEVSLEQADATLSDVDLSLSCRGDQVAASGSSSSSEWIVSRVEPGTECTLELRPLWPIIDQLELDLEFAWRREPSCSTVPGGEPPTFNGDEVFTGSVCPTSSLMIALTGSTEKLELQTRRGSLDAHIVSTIDGAEQVLTVALGSDEEGHLKVDLADLPPPAEAEQRFLRLQPRTSALSGVDFVLAAPDHVLRALER